MKTLQKEQAISLRKSGLSMKKIAAQLGVSLASVSLWVRDVPLSAEQVITLKNKASTGMKLRETARLRQESFKKEGYERASVDAGFRVFCGLYWGEGSKTNNFVGVTNADPKMINAVWKWLVKEGFADRASFALCYHAENGYSESDIKDWWISKVPGLQLSHMRKFSVKNTDNVKIKRVGKLPFGTAILRVNNTRLLCQILGGIDFLAESDWPT